MARLHRSRTQELPGDQGAGGHRIAADLIAARERPRDERADVPASLREMDRLAGVELDAP